MTNEDEDDSWSLIDNKEVNMAWDQECFVEATVPVAYGSEFNTFKDQIKKPVKKRKSIQGLGLGRGGRRRRSERQSISKNQNGDLTSLKPYKIRLQKDLETMDQKIPNVVWKVSDNLETIMCTIGISKGYWKYGIYRFHFDVPSDYPASPPRVNVQQRIYHPNINMNGNVCLSILHSGWKPTYDLQLVLFGILQLFDNPNGKDPLNVEAGELLENNPRAFEKKVRKSMKGLTVDKIKYPNFIGLGKKNSFDETNENFIFYKKYIKDIEQKKMKKTKENHAK